MLEKYFGKMLFDIRVFLFGFYVPVKYSNYNDVSFGSKHPYPAIKYFTKIFLAVNQKVK